ncbi:MAG: hypothetical protein Q9166_004509 [cf. Caloplaca sp. 2 TL-2023]
MVDFGWSSGDVARALKVVLKITEAYDNVKDKASDSTSESSAGSGAPRSQNIQQAPNSESFASTQLDGPMVYKGSIPETPFYKPAPPPETRRQCETIPPDQFLPPPSRTGQRPFANSKASPGPSQRSQSCDVSSVISAQDKVKPPLPPRLPRQPDAASTPAENAKLQPIPRPKPPSLKLPTSPSSSDTPSPRTSSEQQKKDAPSLMANMCPDHAMSPPTTPRSSSDKVSLKRSRSPTGTTPLSTMPSPALTDSDVSVRIRASSNRAGVEGASAPRMEVIDGSLSEAPETLPFADRRRMIEAWLPLPRSSHNARSQIRHLRDRPWARSSQRQPHKEQEKKLTLSDALRETKNEENSLLSPVHIPEDPRSILNENHPAASILANSGIVVQRQLELMNVMIGFEQANKYIILDPQGNHIGFMAEQDNSIGRTMARQMLNTHRSFTTHVFDKHEKEALRFYRPFSWISSRIGVYDPIEAATGSHSKSRDMITSNPGSLTVQTSGTPAQISPLSLSEMRVIGEAQQQWAPLRRRYNLFLCHQSPDTGTNLGTRQIASGDLPLSSSQQLQVSQATPGSSPGEYNQFAYVNEPFLSWDFSLLTANSRKIGSVNRNWGGFGRELFTDTGVYVLRMDAAEAAQEHNRQTGQPNETALLEHRTGMTLDQRAVMLATAVSIDFDYFSRHSGSSSGMGWMPLWFPGGGGETAAAGGAAEGAGAVGAAEEGSVVRGVGSSGEGKVGEGAAVGAGSMAGYEAMQKGVDRKGEDDDLPFYGGLFEDQGNTDSGAGSGNFGGKVDGGEAEDEVVDEEEQVDDDDDFF